MGRPSNSNERRRQIATALLAVMAERGYDGSSITAIAERAGLASGLVHYYFESKRHILLQAMQDLVEVVRQRHEVLLASANTPEERLRAFIEARLAKGVGANDAAVAAWVMIGAEAVREPEVRTEYEKVMTAQSAQLQELLQECAGGELSAQELQELTALVLATMEGVFHLAVSADKVMPKNYAARTILRMIGRYMANSLIMASK